MDIKELDEKKKEQNRQELYDVLIGGNDNKEVFKMAEQVVTTKIK